MKLLVIPALTSLISAIPLFPQLQSPLQSPLQSINTCLPPKVTPRDSLKPDLHILHNASIRTTQAARLSRAVQLPTPSPTP